SLVSSNLRGVDSHGVQLLIWYTEQIAAGNVDVHRAGHIASENGACIVYDGDHAIGQLVSDTCCDHAVRLARDHGLGLVVARNSTHFGAAAWWAQKLARENLLGIVMCNATALVAPWQGRDKMLGTNPICMAVPGPKTFLLDMATTTVALNRIYKALRASHLFLAIDVARFMPMDEFITRMEWLHDTLKSSPPAAGFEEVLVAG